jgi:tRNA (mo5U34)-methyltransferase
MLAQVRRLAKRALGAASPVALGSTRISDVLEIADPPALSLDPRAGDVPRFMQDLHTSLEWYPQGWAGNTDPAAPLADRVASLPWYHTIELPGGVVTPGRYDHRPLVPHYGIPDDVAGKTVLDVGPWDGFWSFEFERRGANVTALDIGRLSDTDLPRAQQLALAESGLDQRLGGGFELAREALGSSVERKVSNVYALNPDEFGTFDIVHFSDVLQHLERPTEALRAVRSVTGGRLMVVVGFDPSLGDASVVRYHGGWEDATWWIPSMRVAGQWIVDAGFTDLRVVSTFRISHLGTDQGVWRLVIIARPA